jgi:uncharacterized membrane protein (GlpM family)
MSADTRIGIKPEQVKKTSWRDLGVRILLGGAISVVTYLVGERFGPTVAGLFLAFPSIMPASMTLVEKHGGEDKAVNSARGTMAGTLGLVAFGATVWQLAPSLSPWLVLPTALLAWLVVAVGGWLVLEWLVSATDDQKRD